MVEGENSNLYLYFVSICISTGKIYKEIEVVTYREKGREV